MKRQPRDGEKLFCLERFRGSACREGNYEWNSRLFVRDEAYSAIVALECNDIAPALCMGGKAMSVRQERPGGDHYFHEGASYSVHRIHLFQALPADAPEYVKIAVKEVRAAIKRREQQVEKQQRYMEKHRCCVEQHRKQVEQIKGERLWTPDISQRIIEGGKENEE